MIMSYRTYRCTRELPYSATSCAGHYDLAAREGYFTTATSEADALSKMADKFPLDVMRTEIEDAFTATCLDEEQYKQASFEVMNNDAVSFDTEPPSDSHPTLVDLTEFLVDDFVDDDDMALEPVASLCEADTIPLIRAAGEMTHYEPVISESPERVDFWR